MRRRATVPRHEAGPAPSARFLALASRPRPELEEALLRGRTPDPGALVGWEFRGMNTSRSARLFGVRKFAKGFARDPGEADRVLGYNLPVAQNPIAGPWILDEKRFGWYRVTPVDPTARDNAYLHAVLLDYGRGEHRRWDPVAGLRDYLVQVDPGDRDLYLGKAYYALGPARVAISFFVLERLRPA